MLYLLRQHQTAQLQKDYLLTFSSKSEFTHNMTKNYIQLHIGGQLRGLKFSNGAYVTFYENVDHKNYLATFYYAVIFAGLSANAYAKREDFTETFETVCDWVDAMSEEDKAAALKVFSETEYWVKQIEEGKKIEATPIEETAEQKKSESETTMTSA